LKRQTAEREEAHKDSTGAKLKLWGDALRNAISRMPNEPIDIVSWFICLERLYEQLKVPSDLRAVLMRPYLSDRAKSLLARCDVDKAADYEAVKKYLLQEMRLSASVYWDKFSSITRENTETFHQFSSRLVSLIEFYVSSREVSGSYQTLLDLIVYDRVKSVLPPLLARHVLALESANEKGWLGRQSLVQALDSYMASSKFALDNREQKAVAPRSWQNGTDGKKVPDKLSTGKVEPVTSQKPVPVSRTGGGKRCFICSSPQHLANMCPQRSGSQANKSGQKPSVNACLLEPMGGEVIQSAQDEANSFTPCSNAESHQLQDSDITVNDVEPTVNKMTVEETGDDVINDDGYQAKECFFRL